MAFGDLQDIINSAPENFDSIPEVIGNAGANTIVGDTGSIAYGLGGNDTMRSLAGNVSWLVGGSGNDLYDINGDTWAVIQDAGGGSDTVDLSRIDIDRDQSFGGFIDNRHLIAFDTTANDLFDISPLNTQLVIVMDFRSAASGIEFVKIQSGTFTRAQLDASLPSLDGFDPNLSFNDVAGFENLGLVLDQLLDLVEARSDALENGQPNLTTSGLKITDAIWTAGEIVRAEWTVGNAGALASGVFRGGLYLSSDANVTTADQFLGSVNQSGGLGAGGDAAQSLQFGAPFGLPPGQYFLGAIADDAGQVAELNEEDNLSNIVEITILADLDLKGGETPDTLQGDVGDDLLTGFGGDDNLLGATGDDTLVGGDGDDTLTGQSGDDSLQGNDGDDTLRGGPGIDALDGGLGDDLYIIDDDLDLTIVDAGGVDTVRSFVTFDLSNDIENLILAGVAAIDGRGNSRDNSIAGNSADNVLRGGGGGDTLNGAAGDDVLLGQVGDDVLAGGLGNDILNGTDGFDQLNGGAGDDRLVGTDGIQDFLTGGADDDVYFVDFLDAIFENDGGGIDTIIIENANGSTGATLSQHIENFSVTGSFAYDLTGNAKANVIAGNNAANVLEGAGGDDVLSGGDGDDTLMHGGGADVLIGGGGVDIADYAAATSAVIANLAASRITVDGVDDSVTEVENVFGSAQNDTLIGDGAANTLTGGDGVDRLDGRDGDDTLIGGDGNDIYTVDSVDDLVIEFVGEGVDRINAFADYVNPLNVEFLVGLFANTGLELTGNAQSNRITGANKIQSPDVILGEGGNDKLIGLVGNDRIEGGDGRDRIFGNSGDDVIIGGAGNDFLTGQQNADTFIFGLGSGIDTITDLQVGVDRIDVSVYGFADFATLDAVIADINGRAQIALNGLVDVLRLNGVVKADLSADDFIFG